MLLVHPLGQFALGGFSSSDAAAVTASAGSYALTFYDVNATFTNANDAGTFTITGQSSVAVTSMPAAAGSFTLDGQDVALGAVYRLAADPFIGTSYTGLGFGALGEAALGQITVAQSSVSFRLNFQDATPIFSIAAEPGSFVLGGQDARLFEGFILNPESATYTLAGQDATFVLVMPAAAGAFTLTAKAVELARFTAKIRAFPRVGRATFSARPTGRDGIKIRAYGG